ncbi:MAG: PAS domain-containing sensor histidine kinase [Bacteroidaceae bacterium]|nr:PAS domain-containing sensor histidine kinase [Bacteroidaceae bacterium]
MKLKYYFFILALGILALMAITLYGTFHSHPRLFYVTEGFVVLLILYLWLFYQKTLRPYDTLVSGIELVRDLDLTTRLSPTGQPETDIIVQAFNDLLVRLRSEHLSLEEQYTFLSLLINASPMGIVQCDIDGNITSMNPAAKQMMSPSVEEAMRKLPLGQETTIRLPGEPQLFRINYLSFPDRGFQHPFYLIESLTDEVRRAEKAAYERVIRMIAHEVNNSVAGIVGQIHNSQFIIHKEAADASERLKALSAFVTRFAQVVKIPQPQLQLCDLSEEVDACRPFLESLCTAANVRLEFNLTEEATPVRLDTVLFQQVLINIVKNSVESIRPTSIPSHNGGKHTIQNNGTITITTQYSPSSGGDGGGLLTITDNGHGISPEVAQNLFTPFYSTKPQGQGLGLLLIRDILTAHGCTFSLLTDPNDHLTRFTIQFKR